MEVFNGKSLYSGIAIGKIAIYHKEDQTVIRKKVDDVDAEIQRFDVAKETAKTQLKELYEKALKEIGQDNAMIFEVHQLMLDDLDFVDSIHHMIASQNVNAEYAVAKTGDNFYEIFSTMDDEYMKERATDIKEVAERVVTILYGEKKKKKQFNEPVIIMADDLAPSETLQLDKSKVLSFVTELGSTNSHTAILARAMNIPALIGVKNQAEFDGKMAIVDGFHGILYMNPDEETLNKYKKLQKDEEQKSRLLQELKGKENITVDGRTIDIFANIGSVSDVANVLQNDAGGIGLFRSEFLYLEKDTFPTEEEQFQAYKTVIEVMAGKKVIIRTLDIGADKKVDYFNLGQEENPAMGYRAIRICLKQKDIFKTQLRAIFRASIYGNVAIMYPMIISVNEVLEIKKIVEEVKEELANQGIPFQNVEQGIMIETPAAVMISDLLAKEVDFFSIGTNDLTQYTLAIDRQNPKLEDFYNAHHTAILRMIQMVTDNAHANGCFVGICGELGADLKMTEEFLKMGIDELSVSPSLVLKVREKVRSLNLRD